MFATHWFAVPMVRRAPRPNKESRPQPARRPIHSRPSLEHLEERTLLDASSGIVLPNVPNVPITTGVTAQFFPTAGGEAALAATSAFIAQDQGSAQFRAFAVNSQGANNQLAQTTTDILLLAYGFGSGVSPNAPWMPASYNLGLANHQFNNLAQSDFGSPSVPPWYQLF